MKRMNLVLSLAIALLFGAQVTAQDAQNPWGISIGFHAVDHTSVRGVFDGFLDVDDYSIVPPLSKISVIRHLNGGFAADLTASVGDIDNKRIGLGDQFFLNAGLGLRYTILKDSWFDPYLRIGASYHQMDYSSVSIDKNNPRTVANGTGANGGSLVYGDFDGQEAYFITQAGLGLNLWFTDHVGINLATDYNGAPSLDSDYVNFFQHSAGITFKFGKQDRDGDGISDKDDACPDTWGLEEFNGCPDTDGDGVVDSEDACPLVAGDIQYQGCPDTDGDGVADNKDNCVNEAGPIDNNGCPWPDSDNDGLTDNLDKCPNQAGPRENGGCPWPDSDNDGFTDNVDKCPNEAGVAPDGCPEAVVMVNNINIGFVVEFDYDKATIRSSSLPKVQEKANEIKGALQVYPSMTLYIDGHTDSKGSASYNKKLSQKRANSIVEALEQYGIADGVLTPRGLGETVPKCSNETEEGRQCNRRVEVNIKSTGAVK